jgi:hypothetical protein
MPIIPPRWEAEIGRIVASGQYREKNLSANFNRKKMRMVVHACHPNKGRKQKIGVHPLYFLNVLSADCCLVKSCLWITQHLTEKIQNQISSKMPIPIT